MFKSGLSSSTRGFFCCSRIHITKIVAVITEEFKFSFMVYPGICRKIVPIDRKKEC